MYNPQQLPTIYLPQAYNVLKKSPPNAMRMCLTLLCHAGMGYQAYLNMGGAPRGTPGFNEAVVYDPIPSRTMPFLLMISVLGAFLLTQMRKLMICDWKLPFPSGTASGIMLTSFHTAVSLVEAKFWGFGRWVESVAGKAAAQISAEGSHKIRECEKRGGC
jgi:hypothetical protein